MSLRELVALGTSSQVPTRYRNHNGYLLRWDGRGLLFDPGEGTQRQMIMAEVTATDITRILITHFHGDHCLGLAGITQRISLDRVPHEVSVHYPASGEQFYRRLRKASIFKDMARTKACPIEGPGVLYEDDEVVLSCQRLSHPVDTFGYRFEERSTVRMLPEKLAELGVKGRAIGDLKRNGAVEVDGRTVRLEDVSEPKPGQSFAFVMDTRYCPGCVELARGVDMLVCESTFLSSERREARSYGHMTAEDAGRLAAVAGVGTLVLTHFSQRYPSTKPFVAEAKRHHEDVVAVRDGDRVRLR